MISARLPVSAGFMRMSTAMSLLVALSPAKADVGLAYRYQVDANKPEQLTVQVKNGVALMSNIGGPGVDAFYRHTERSLAIVDHAKHSVMPITERDIETMARQAEELAPLMRGVTEQLKHLAPAQRQRAEALLGDLQLGPLLKSPTQREPAEVDAKPTNKREIAGFPCQGYVLKASGGVSASVCVARPDDLKIESGDQATLLGVLELARGAARKLAPIAAQLGVRIPTAGYTDLQGIPLAFNGGADGDHVDAVLERLSIEPLTAELGVPKGYRREALPKLGM